MKTSWTPIVFFGDYVATYIERDVRQLINIRNVRDFDQFMWLLALRSGQIFSMSRIATEVGVSTNTIKSWISVLEASNIIYLLKPYYKNFGKRIIKSPKLYFIDTGLLCYLMNIQTSDTLRNNPLLGAVFETYALGQLLRSLHNQGKPDELYYFRDKDGREVDFLYPKGICSTFKNVNGRMTAEKYPKTSKKYQRFSAKKISGKSAPCQP